MKKKTLMIVAIVLAVALVASITVFFVTKSKNSSSPLAPESSTTEYSFNDSEYTAAVSVAGKNGEIFLPTDISGVYYTADLSGNVAFYEYSDGEFAASSLEVKQISTSIKASKESIPVTVKYIEKDGKTFGCGVFTSDMNANVEIYSYAFVKLTNKPAGYGEGYLLLADFEKENFYKSEKIYSEIYNFNLSTGSASTYVSNNTRLIDKNGAYRNDWTMLTDEFIANLGDAKYFISSRYYTGEERGTRSDIMVLSNNYRPEIVAEDIIGMWFVNDASGMHYLKKTDTGFASVVNEGGTETVAANFDGDFFADYMLSGNYLINRSSLVITNLITNSTVTLADIDISDADYFSMNEEGTKAVFAKYGKTNSNGTVIQTLIFCNTDGSEPAIYSEPLLFSEITDFVWLDESSVMSGRAITADASQSGSVIYKF